MAGEQRYGFLNKAHSHRVANGMREIHQNLHVQRSGQNTQYGLA